MSKTIISLFDFTGIAVKPWADDGYDCHIYDIKHCEDGGYADISEHQKYNHKKITAHQKDLFDYNNLCEIISDNYKNIKLVFCFLPCTHLSVSGARWFPRKRAENPNFQHDAIRPAVWLSDLCDKLNITYVIENPVSVLSTLWRKPNYIFHPYEYGGYIPKAKSDHPHYPDYVAPQDGYSKKTCLWTSKDFKMPKKFPVHCKDFGNESYIHKKLGGGSEKSKTLRSLTPRGFAEAVWRSSK